MNRFAYLVRRLLLVIPTFLGITMVCFALTRFLPGGPVEIQLMKMRNLGGANDPGSAAVGQVTEEYRQELTRQFGFDRPLPVQYYDWLVRKRMGLLIASYDYPNRTAWQLIASRIPVSLWFGITGFVLSYLICIPLGVAKALRHRQPFDAISSLIVFAGYAIPAFALGMVLKMFFCGTVEGLADLFPLGGFESDLPATAGWGARMADRAWHMALPVTCYVAGNFAVLTLIMKNALLDQIASDYVRTVLAKGATRRRAIWGHAFRNALIPVATGFGSILGVLFAGSIIIENIFEIPGMGRLSWEALTGRDYAVFLALLALTSLLQLAGNLLSDFCYLLIDPRIHFGDT
ncbi:MAG TPA: ABC transporter permease subunit [Kiritimatiellia bacterium]|jgi:microcin C transport system permease protein|nr:ABC transporter permease subunit [Kiritimatiellia bacterium]HOR96945.1 ABC transporter permease subunit [Kiritimatiellia bacterium]HPC48620.1 ABC transporter permease subunit [Kiritimatiellia bacterium]HPW74778.1 ABC transporter permease subunit [Kiritimatiellia bacterium]